MKKNLLLLVLLAVVIASGCKGREKTESTPSTTKDTTAVQSSVGDTSSTTESVTDSTVVKKNAPEKRTQPKQKKTDSTTKKQSSSNASPSKNVEEKDTGLNFTVPLLGGGTLTLKDYRGKVVILDFWATWCGPCRMEIPSFIELQKKYADKVQFIGIAVSDKPDRVAAFYQKLGMNYPVGFPTKELMQIKEFSSIRAIPTTFIIDKKGHIRYRQVGYAPKDFFEQWINNLSGEK